MSIPTLCHIAIKILESVIVVVVQSEALGDRAYLSAPVPYRTSVMRLLKSLSGRRRRLPEAIPQRDVIVQKQEAHELLDRGYTLCESVRYRLAGGDGVQLLRPRSRISAI